MSRFAIGSALAVITTVIVGCGSSNAPDADAENDGTSPSDISDPTAVPAQTLQSGGTPSPISAESVTRTVSASSGGRLTTGDSRITFEFPPGALTSDTEIAIVPVDDPDAVAATPFLPDEVANVYRLEPADIVLNQPVRVEINIDHPSGRGAGNAAPLTDDDPFRGPAIGLGMIIDDNLEGEWLDEMAIETDPESDLTRLVAEFDEWGDIVLTHPLMSISTVFLDNDFQILRTTNVGEPFLFSMTFDFRDFGRGGFEERVTSSGEIRFSSKLKVLSADPSYVNVIEAQNGQAETNADFSVTLSPNSSNLETAIDLECTAGASGLAVVDGVVHFDFFEIDPPTVRFISQQTMACNGALTADRMEPARTLPGFETTIFGSGFMDASALNEALPLNVLFIDDESGTVIMQQPFRITANSITLIVPEELAEHEARVWKVEVVRGEQRASLQAIVYIESWPSIEGEWSYTGKFDECERVGGQTVCKTVEKSGNVTFTMQPRRWNRGEIADEPLNGKGNEERSFEEGGSCGTNWLWETDPNNENFGKIAVAPSCDPFYFGELAKDYSEMTLTDENGNVVTMTNLAK